MAKTKGVSGRRRVRFEVRAEPKSEVFVTGSFNSWDPKKKALEDKKQDGFYSGTLMLPKGTYEYKFVINGVWCADPECEEWTANEHGSLNSVIRVD